MKKKYILPLLSVVFLAYWAYNRQQTNSSNSVEKEHSMAQPAPSFKTFYNKFHSDSIYQMNHIQFPLQGLPNRLDSITLAENDFYWQKEDWELLHDFDEAEMGYTKFVTAISPEMVEERIIENTGEHAMVRRFVKIGSEWYLIYYSGLNRVK